MSDLVHVVVDALPKDDTSLYLGISTGIIVPVLLLVMSWYFSSQAEKRSKLHAEQLRYLDRKQIFLDNTHAAIDDLYKKVQMLRIINLKRKSHEVWSKETVDHNKAATSETPNEARVMYQDLLKWHMDKNLELDTQHGTTSVDVISAQTRLQHVVSEGATSKIDTSVVEIIKISKTAGSITDEMVTTFVNELNNLMKDVEDNPDKWMTV